MARPLPEDIAEIEHSTDFYSALVEKAATDSRAAIALTHVETVALATIFADRHRIPLPQTTRMKLRYCSSLAEAEAKISPQEFATFTHLLLPHLDDAARLYATAPGIFHTRYQQITSESIAR